MQDEIFGPILPFVNVNNAYEAIKFINSRWVFIFIFSNIFFCIYNIWRRKKEIYSKLYTNYYATVIVRVASFFPSADNDFQFATGEILRFSRLYWLHAISANLCRGSYKTTVFFSSRVFIFKYFKKTFPDVYICRDRCMFSLQNLLQKLRSRTFTTRAVPTAYTLSMPRSSSYTFCIFIYKINAQRLIC